MNEHIEYPRKNLDREPSGGAYPDGFPRNLRKDGLTPAAARREQTGRAKPSVEASLALHGPPNRRKNRGPQVPIHQADNSSSQSLRLRLQVRGKRIDVLNSNVVDVGPSTAPTVRGTSFLEVRANNLVVALAPLPDPGLSVGIPDSRDSAEEFRGHRIVEDDTWEVAVRIPIEVLTERGDGELSVSIYTATEQLVLDTAPDTPLSRRSRRVEEIAAGGPLRVADLPGAPTTDDRKRPDTTTS
ncbi:hypothetical protein GOEFS_077_00400 [Gordonia effusa NBRC 100432]|uniref:Uncharacterized protein n=1 Tax=Gordonia effusa NBRC 100432 TaxID=1077974 RepID=H0R2E7_9ACTN|nr:hypothetical protein [Gordonia effusa]GAB19248.1 hypothetical protein GOEFS_077_00400 [Gordonia effusa NBRC 100432]